MNAPTLCDPIGHTSDTQTITNSQLSNNSTQWEWTHFQGDHQPYQATDYDLEDFTSAQYFHTNMLIKKSLCFSTAQRQRPTIGVRAKTTEKSCPPSPKRVSRGRSCPPATTPRRHQSAGTPLARYSDTTLNFLAIPTWVLKEEIWRSSPGVHLQLTFLGIIPSHSTKRTQFCCSLKEDVFRSVINYNTYHTYF